MHKMSKFRQDINDFKQPGVVLHEVCQTTQINNDEAGNDVL
jgi:hypothetical protein